MTFCFMERKSQFIKTLKLAPSRRNRTSC